MSGEGNWHYVYEKVQGYIYCRNPGIITPKVTLTVPYPSSLFYHIITLPLPSYNLLSQDLPQYKENVDYFPIAIDLLAFVPQRFEERGYDVARLVELAGNTLSIVHSTLYTNPTFTPMLTHPFNTPIDLPTYSTRLSIVALGKANRDIWSKLAEEHGWATGDTPDQLTRLIDSINTPDQHTRLTHPINTPY